MGMVGCNKHGRQSGWLCCDHVREAVEHSMPVLSFEIYLYDIVGDGTEMLEHMLCTYYAFIACMSSRTPRICIIRFKL
jgi:hypothetical protein